MDPSVSIKTASEFDPKTHMRTPTGMITGFHIDAFIKELHACRSRADQMALLDSFKNVYHLNGGFFFETSLMLHLDVDAPGFDGAADVGFTIDVYRADYIKTAGIGSIKIPVPLECAPGHIIEVYGLWKTKIEEWLAGEKWCPLTRNVPITYPAIEPQCGPVETNPYRNGELLP